MTDELLSFEAQRMPFFPCQGQTLKKADRERGLLTVSTFLHITDKLVF